MSMRAIRVLGEVDVVAAEDTRRTGLLLRHFGIENRLESYFDFNKEQKGPLLIQRLLNGESIAVVSDAGTPGISDPAFNLVRSAIEKGIQVVPVPGPAAAVTALTVSGLPTDRFVFEGFLPAKSAARRAALQALAQETRTLVFYEGPHRLEATLQDLAAVFGAERAAAVGREITKRFEHVYRGTLAALASQCASDANMTRGEIVLVVAGAPRQVDEDAAALAAAGTLKVLLQELPVSQAARIAAQLTGRGRKELYELALALQQEARASD